MIDKETIKQYELEIEAQKKSQVNANSFSPAMFSMNHKQNLIEWELDFKPELESIERLLRSDILFKDEKGNEFWITNPDKAKVFLNELGVNDVMRTILILVNKGKALSNYDHEEIRMRVRLILHELRRLIYKNYDYYGIDNDYKINNYEMIVVAIGTVIEDIYRRAMNGETHKGLNDQRIVTQSEPLNQMQSFQNLPSANQGSKHWYNPFSWNK